MSQSSTVLVLAGFLLKAVIAYYLVDTQQAGIAMILSLTFFIDFYIIDSINDKIIKL